MILFLVGPITSLNQSFNINQVMADKLPANASVDVYINSPGGRIDQAFLFGKSLSRLNTTCYVQFAASAAFEVVMPACKKIVMAPASRVVFHSAMWCIQGMKDTADILTDLREGLRISNIMASLMTNYWGPSQCSKQLRQKFADVNAPCSVLHMLQESELTGQQFKDTFLRVAPLVNLVRQENFPPIPNPIVEVNNVPVNKSECEVL